jgi:2-polyprenyl-6-methoxyphenol hydroxylase-like FAD-dependent oxidoreductase
VRVTGLLTAGPSSVPQVVGVRTDDGEVTADLVVDAGGRRSVVGRWITEVGGRAPEEERADSGFAYYSRHYRAADRQLPVGLDSWLTHHESVCVLTLPTDNNTWAVGFTVGSRDRELRALRHVPVWEAAMRRYPLTRHWLEAAPITDVTVMAGIDDRLRRFVVDGRPVVTGLVAVGDAWACTNPSLGRGASIGAMHACVLRDVLAKDGTTDAEALVLRFAAETDARVAPFVESTLAFDRHRLAEMEAAAAGTAYQPDDQGWAMTRALWAGSRHDPVLARTLATIAGVLATPGDLLGDPALVERIRPDLGRSHLAPGPDRSELVTTVRRAAA